MLMHYSLVVNLKDIWLSSTTYDTELKQNSLPVILKDYIINPKNSTKAYMNGITEKIKQCIFVDKKEAIIVFDHLLRSFIPGWTLHKGKTTMNSAGLEKTVLSFHMESQ